MKYALYLGKVLGVKIYVHWTFIFLIGWIILSGLRNDLALNSFFWVFSLTLVVFGCIVLHELGHALAARRFNIETKYITLLPIGGIAQLESIPDNPKHELLIAIAGPAVNIAVAAILFPFVNVHALQPEALKAISTTNFLFTIIVINLWIAIFNLVPAFPMDGGRILRATLSFWINREKATKIAATVGQVFGTAFFFAGFVYSPMLIFIGLLVILGGQYEYALVDTMRLLKAFTVNDVLMREIPTLENSYTLKEAGAKLLTTQNTNFVVLDNGKPVGTISRDQIIQAVYEKEENTSIEKIKNEKLVYAEPSMPLDEAWKMMRDGKSSVLLAGSNSHLDGIVDEENITEFIQLKSGVKLRGRK